MATIGGWRCSRGRTDRGRPFSDSDNTHSQGAGNATFKSTLLALLIFAGLFAIVFFLIKPNDEHHVLDDSDTSMAEVLDAFPVDTSLICFRPEDVTISKGWSILVGIHPTVTFSCRCNSPERLFKRAVLCYHPKGASGWMTVETRVRRDNSARINLSDLPRGVTYECFYILVGDKGMVRSRMLDVTR